MMFQKVVNFLKSEWNHYLMIHAEQRQYELQQEVKTLEKAYDDSKSQYIWDKLEEVRRQLTNVSARLARYRMMRDGKS